ncbi:Acyl-coenzyme A thioesterase 8 [Strongyloides ratti]|uniref:Acyl-coenzyme A thioesterase 8 n=1 Tax=Strongyloides ratti TaxID=34506 RepID=A0A090L903_STRRB|nr:Acyl-coenzyme A thioesterase 8 [Strongyloides ratti]CEF66187.1 Acyl-coenzyme A thioesterase 8 [Strongyloides ratti]
MNIYFLSFLTFSSFICSILKISNDLTFKTKNIRKNKGRASVYGGQLISNSIFAAQKTVDKDFYCHSSHIYFLNAVNVDGSLIYKVKKIRDSKNFALRKTEEPSICHQGVMPDIPKPEDLKEQDFYMEELQKINLKELNSGQILSINIAKNFYHDSFCYRRIYKPMTYFCIERGDGGLQNYYSWIRSFMSDSGIIDYAQKQHIVEGYVPNFSTSLDHSLYFHTSNINMNEWILLEAISPRAEGGRAIIMGKFWSRDGLHLATLIQESLHRTKEAKSKM